MAAGDLHVTRNHDTGEFLIEREVNTLAGGTSKIPVKGEVNLPAGDIVVDPASMSVYFKSTRPVAPLPRVPPAIP